MRKLKNTTLLQNDGALLSDLQRNALASALRWRPETVFFATRQFRTLPWSFRQGPWRQGT